MQHHDVIVHLIGERNKGFYQRGSCIITAEYALCSTGVIRSAKTLAVSFTFFSPPNLLEKKSSSFTIMLTSCVSIIPGVLFNLYSPSNITFLLLSDRLLLFQASLVTAQNAGGASKGILSSSVSFPRTKILEIKRVSQKSMK